MSDSSDPGAQNASVSSGSGNLIVQIVGDGNRVVAGCHRRLTLTRYLSRREVRSDFDRLSPYTMSAPLVGRDNELDSLKTFLVNPRPLLVRVITGQGGSGKTRLALELSDFASARGWAAGFVPGREMRSFLRDGMLIQWAWSQPSLLIVDYVAQHARLLGDWLEALSDRAERGAAPLRILLLEREASTDAGWWPLVFGMGGYGADAKRALLDPPEPVDLAPLRDIGQRLEVLRGVFQHRRTPAQIERLESDPAFLRRLESVPWGGDPLSLLMAALTMSQHTGGETLALTRTDLAMQLAKDHEANRIRALAREQGLDDVLVVHLAACVTLARGMDLDSLEQLAEAEKLAIRRPSGGDPAALADLLREALPAREGNGVAAVVPDLVGEAFVLSGVAGQNPGEAVVRCHERFGARVTESVIRAAQDFGADTKKPVDWLQVLIDRTPNDWRALNALDAQIPVESLALREAALRMAERLVATAKADPEVSEAQMAQSYNALGVAQAQVGQREAALAASRQAVSIYRTLAIRQPDAFGPELASSLNNLANGLSALGQGESALASAEEAVAIRRALADQRPDALRPDFAMSLNTLANMLSLLGHRERALAVAEEAVPIRRVLADERPDAFRPDLARSLNTLVNMLSDLGHYDRALFSAEEALLIRRALANERPDAFRPDLATSLHNLANMLSASGQHERALAVASEAVSIRRGLADGRPNAFRPDLAMSLNNLANRLCALGYRERARTVAEEAVTIFRVLADDHPDTFRPGLATSLMVLALVSEGPGNATVAAGLAVEAVQTLTPHFIARPQAHGSLMLACLRDYLRLCEVSEVEPDATLLEPLLPYFGSEIGG